jgi:hypothetical protein
MESEARLVMIDGGLPPPVLQYEIVDKQGCTWRLDLAWPELRVAAEYDGVDWHNGPDAFLRDRRRAAALLDLGWSCPSWPGMSGTGAANSSGGSRRDWSAAELHDTETRVRRMPAATACRRTNTHARRRTRR